MSKQIIYDAVSNTQKMLYQKHLTNMLDWSLRDIFDLKTHTTSTRKDLSTLEHILKTELDNYLLQEDLFLEFPIQDYYHNAEDSMHFLILAENPYTDGAIAIFISSGITKIAYPCMDSIRNNYIASSKYNNFSIASVLPELIELAEKNDIFLN